MPRSGVARTPKPTAVGAPPPGFEEIDVGAAPAGFEPVEPTPTIMERMGGRLFGTDVEDPMPYTRLAGTIAGAVGGFKLGAAGGGLVGGGPGAAAGGAIGGLAGTVAGAASPELIAELSEQLGLLEPGYREANMLSNEDLKTVLEGEALLEMATAGGLGAARLVGRDVARIFTGVTKKKSMLAEAASRQGINMMPVVVGDRSMARSFVGVLGRFPFVAGPLRKNGQLADDALATAFTNLPPRIAIPASMNDLSAEIFSSMKQLATDIDLQFKGRYEKVFKLADQMGVKIKPENTIKRANELIAKMAAETPASAPGRPRARPADSIRDLQKFIAQSVMPMAGDTGTLANQSLQQMDQLMETVDAKIAEFVRKKEGLPLKYLEQLRNAIHTDMMDLGRGKMGPGAMAPREIGRQLRAIDADFSNTMATLFETATANKLGRVAKRGFGGISYQQATQVPVDHLADILMRGDAPSTVVELQRMIPPELFKRVASSTIERRLAASVQYGSDGAQLSMEKFAKSLGIGDVRSNRYIQMSKLLDAAGGLSMKEVESLVTIGRQIGSVEIPDVSTFVARRASIGGIRSAADAIIPGLAAAVGSRTGANTRRSNLALLMGGLMFMGGGRMISKAISNPDTARPLRYVLQAETTRVGRRTAYSMVMRGAVWGLVDAGQLSAEDAKRALAIGQMYLEELDKFTDAKKE